MEFAMEYTKGFTKYEKARIIGARALQLSMGAPVLIKLSDDELLTMNYSTLRIAILEFDKGLIPISVLRPVKQKGTEWANADAYMNKDANADKKADANVDGS